MARPTNNRQCTDLYAWGNHIKSVWSQCLQCHARAVNLDACPKQTIPLGHLLHVVPSKPSLISFTSNTPEECKQFALFAALPFAIQTSATAEAGRQGVRGSKGNMTSFAAEKRDWHEMIFVSQGHTVQEWCVQYMYIHIVYSHTAMNSRLAVTHCTCNSIH